MPRVAAVGRVAVAGRVAIPQTSNFLDSNRTLGGADWVSVGEAGTDGHADPLGGIQAYEIDETAVITQHTRLSNGSNPVPIMGELGNRSVQWLCSSVFMRPGTRTFGGMLVDLGAANVFAIWNLSTGANTLLSATGGEIFEATALPSETFSDGWRRYAMCWRSRLTPAGGFVVQPLICFDGATIIYLGVPGSTIRIFAPALSAANRAGPITDTTAGPILTRIRNEARGRVAP